MLDYRRRGSGDVKQTQFTNLLDFALITGWQIPSVFFFFPANFCPLVPTLTERVTATRNFAATIVSLAIVTRMNRWNFRSNEGFAFKTSPRLTVAMFPLCLSRGSGRECFDFEQEVVFWFVIDTSPNFNLPCLLRNQCESYSAKTMYTQIKCLCLLFNHQQIASHRLTLIGLDFNLSVENVKNERDF